MTNRSKLQHENEVTKNNQRYTYRDCLKGAVPVPHGQNGSTLFQVLMVGGMVTFMVTINGLRNVGPSFFLQSHWLYPIIFCLAFLVRTFISSKLANKLIALLVDGKMNGVRKTLAITVINVGCTAPIMCAIATLLISGASDFAWRYATTLPIAAPIAVAVNMFVVGPIVKLLFNNRISPAKGIDLLSTLQSNVPSLARLLGIN